MNFVCLEIKVKAHAHSLTQQNEQKQTDRTMLFIIRIALLRYCQFERISIEIIQKKLEIMRLYLGCTKQ